MMTFSAAAIAIMWAFLGAPLTPSNSRDIFADYEEVAEQKLSIMTLDEKIGQVLLVRYPDADGVAELERYQFGGYVFFEKDFQDKTVAEVQQMMAELQAAAKIPILTAVDEEGGLVVRVSSNSNLAPSRFASPQDLYVEGGLARIAEDALAKSAILEKLGINLNLAPVVDVSTNANDYMYSRSLGEDAELTSEYAKTVIKASQDTKVSYTLKHFPGYGNNSDTHKGGSVDERTYEEILASDLLPFRAGIDAGAEAVLVSHNLVNSVDAEFPASLSPKVHQLLGETLGFTGVVMTDDIAMGALDEYGDTAAQALKAGNDLVITTDYQRSINEIKTAITEGRLSEEQLGKAAKKILAWKYAKNLI